MPKALLNIGFLIALLHSFSGLSQPPINERYAIDDENFSVFSSVISTDSCYYVSGMQGTTLVFIITIAHLYSIILMER
ncbi:hypothetical protein N8987_02220 [Crocinitomix sp.]|nr:hypothetical protein [Crocinitomix sp.]